MNRDDQLDAIWHAMWRQTMGREPIWPREAYLTMTEDEIKITDPTRKRQGMIEMVQGPDGVWRDAQEMPENAAPWRSYYLIGMVAGLYTPPGNISGVNLSI